MDKRYERFNEVTFEVYIKAAIDQSVKKARLRQAAQNSIVQTFSMLSDAVLYTFAAENTETERAEMECQHFTVRGITIPVYGKKLGQALSQLMPKDREIILLYYFLGLNDQKIAKVLGISRTTVQRRRRATLTKLQYILEGII